jgi:large subunit ribosomal protein L4
MSLTITLLDKKLSTKQDAFPSLVDYVVKAHLLAQVVKAELANIRVSRAHTKTRSEVSGGGKKPWKQKGTGRARHGSTRSPIWVKGGVTFGPRSATNWHQKINKSSRISSLKSILKDRLDSNTVFELAPKYEFTKTSSAVEILQGLEKTTGTKLSKTILVYTSDMKPMLRGFVNSGINLINAQNLKIYKLVSNENIILTPEAREVLETKINK